MLYRKGFNFSCILKLIHFALPLLIIIFIFFTDTLIYKLFTNLTLCSMYVFRNQNCEWLISANAGHKILFRTTDIACPGDGYKCITSMTVTKIEVRSSVWNNFTHLHVQFKPISSEILLNGILNRWDKSDVDPKDIKWIITTSSFIKKHQVIWAFNSLRNHSSPETSN